MEAPGHEEIEQNLADFIKNLMASVAKADSKYKPLYEQLFGSKAKVPFDRALYMGNWLSDTTQLFVPDTYFDVQYNLKDNLTALHKTFKELPAQIKFGILGVQASGIGAKALDALLTKLFKMPTHSLEQLSRLPFRQPDPHSFVFDSRNEWWQLCHSLLKLLGYHKFCLPAKKSEKMPFDIFKSIFGSFVDQEPAGQRSLFFKLNQYYPSDHLDRAFYPSPGIWKSTELKKQERAEQYLQDNQPKNGERLSDNVKDNYQQLGAMRRNCYDDTIEPGANSYTFLQQYKTVLGQKLNYLNARFIAPKVLRPAMVDHAFYIDCARLGHALHGVEDFFAHSNFLELTVQGLDALRPQMAKPEDYYSQSEYIKEISRKNDFEKDRYLKAINKPIRKVDYTKEEQRRMPTPVGETEFCLSTGIFGEGDTLTSIYHLVFGKTIEKLEDIIDDADFIKTPFYKFISTFIEYFQEYIRLMEEARDTIPSKYRVAVGKEAPAFNADVIKFILNRNTDPKTKIHDKQLFSKIDDQSLSYFSEVLNAIQRIYAAVSLATLSINIVLHFVLVMLMLLFMPYVIRTLYRDLVDIIPKRLVQSTAKYYFKDLIENQLLNLGTQIENNTLGLGDAKMWGCHSLIAKDDKFKNENWNYQAKRMAQFVNKCIILHMIYGTDITAQKQVNFELLIAQLLRHPLPSLSTQIQQKQDNDFGETGVVYVNDIQTGKIADMELKKIYDLGVFQAIDIQKFREQFFILNGFSLYIGLMMDKGIKLSQLGIPDLNLIILPYQRLFRDYIVINNAIIPKSVTELKEVVVVGQSLLSNKLWMMQFFNKKYYSSFTNDGMFKEFFKNITEAIFGSKETSIDTVPFFRNVIQFGEDPSAVMDINNIERIDMDRIDVYFEVEKKIKKEYESFIIEFVKVRYGTNSKKNRSK